MSYTVKMPSEAYLAARPMHADTVLRMLNTRAVIETGDRDLDEIYSGVTLAHEQGLIDFCPGLTAFKLTPAGKQRVMDLIEQDAKKLVTAKPAKRRVSIRAATNADEAEVIPVIHVQSVPENMF